VWQDPGMEHRTGSGSPVPVPGCFALLAAFLIALATLSIGGCTPAAFGAGVGVARVVVHWTCEGAIKICEATGHQDRPACEAIDRVCAFVDTAGGARVEPAPAPDLAP
jgi:hypothetical protein